MGTRIVGPTFSSRPRSQMTRPLCSRVHLSRLRAAAQALDLQQQRQQARHTMAPMHQPGQHGVQCSGVARSKGRLSCRLACSSCQNLAALALQ